MLKRFAACRKGSTAVEYSLLSSALALALVIGVTEAARTLEHSLDQLGTAFDQAFAEGASTRIDPPSCEAGNNAAGPCR